MESSNGNMASSVSPIQCGICLWEYDNTNHRPRTLACAHSFCSQCLENCISMKESKCSACSRAFTAVSIDDIPINTDLEKVSQIMSVMAVDNSSNIETVDKGEVMKTKVATLKEAEEKIDYLDMVKNMLENVVIEKKANIEIKEDLVKCLLKEIDEENKCYDQMQNDISESKIFIRKFQSYILKLQMAVTMKKINQEYSEFQENLGTLGNFTKELNRKYNMEELKENQHANEASPTFLLKDPRRTSKLMQAKSMSVYAIEGENIMRSSQILPLGQDSLQLGSMEENVRPPLNATLIPVKSLLSAFGAQPVVYLGLQAGGKPLGRIRICLTSDPNRMKQMLMLCVGHGGATWKGSAFSRALDVGCAGECIISGGYITPEGTESTDLIVQYVEGDECQWAMEGAVTGSEDQNTNFQICIRTKTSDTRRMPELGRVVAGLDMLHNALRNCSTSDGGYYHCDATQIKIVEVGVEIGGQ